MKNYITPLGFCLLTALSACKVSKDIDTPKPALPVAFRNVATVTTAIPAALLIYSGKTFLPMQPCKS
jgi:hypothetical protein